jgi:S-adenosylmethionine:tRNA ribosyltransferase-isomerase
MSLVSGININDYTYDLPRERIAEYPVKERDQSKLLITDHAGIAQDRFENISKYLPGNGLMVFNNTRVIRARLLFFKNTGARIEVFCLEPVEPSAEINIAFESASPVVWRCLIGNARKWRSGKLNMMLGNGRGSLSAEQIGKEEDSFLVRFSWDTTSASFSEILDDAGKVPLPPYIEREAEEGDIHRYQTIYALHDGSVAAPTAGLHFTERVLDTLKKKDISFGNVTLHVGAGTFKPVEESDIRKHNMHTEQIIAGKTMVQKLLSGKDHITAVGTTSMRTLESLYWYGVMLEEDKKAAFSISQWEPYIADRRLPSREKALNNILALMESEKREFIAGDTSLIIVPGYQFHIADILVTNFHMPRSTLLLLVAAFAGDRWKEAYQYALNHDFRFLSYGDSCLFFREDYKG